MTEKQLVELRSVARGFGSLSSVAWTENWKCKKLSCKRIGSCEQAYYLLLVCGHKARDGDGDGVPCEKRCRVVDDDKK